MKPKHLGGYTALHTELCERTLVTLLRGLGPWKDRVYLVGGLVPRYLTSNASEGSAPPHAGTTDVDLVLDLEVLADVEAYRRLEDNLKAIGFVRGRNDEGQAQHFSWRMPVGAEATVVVVLLCAASPSEGGGVVRLANERRLSALRILGAHLVTRDFVPIELTAELLGERGVATETVRVAGVIAFLVLKALAYEDRIEEKDVYDIGYTLMHYGDGPDDVAAAFTRRLQEWTDEPLLHRAIDILRRRFAPDELTAGHREDGPRSYARFLADPARTELTVRHQRDAAAVVERLLTGPGGEAGSTVLSTQPR